MRVLAVHRYFWPDTPPYASLLRLIARRWVADGHRVEVLAGRTPYKRGVDMADRPALDHVDGFAVRRVSLLDESRRGPARALNMLLFSLLAARRVLFGRYDVVMTSTSPPVLLGWAVSLAARVRRAAFVYHCMDIHPEIGRLSGDFARPSVYDLLLRLDRSACRRAALVVVLSGDMERALAQRPLARDVALTSIPNVDLPELDGDLDASLLPAQSARRRVVFTGNVGRFQALDVVLDGWAQLPRGSWELVIMGAGSALDEVRERSEALGLTDLVLLPHANVATARALIRSADLCLVSLMSGVESLAFPSKTMTYLAEGRPVLAVVEPGSELARFVEHEGVGVVASIRDSSAMPTLLARLRDEPQLLDRLHDETATRGPALCDPKRVLDEWSELLLDVAGARR